MTIKKILKGIKTYKPKNLIIRQYVSYYYEVTLENIAYYAYPHYNLPLSIINSSDIRVIDNNVKINQSGKKGLKLLAVNKYTSPLKIEINGKIRDFCIVFKPYGLSNFINHELDLSSKKEITIIDLFNDLPESINNFFNIDANSKINLLEDYLLSKQNINKNNEIVIKVFDYFFKEEEHTLTEIAMLCNCHPKKIYRLFKYSCGDSPIVFKKIIQFRKILEKIKKTILT